jgi:ABC-type lipoprotein export system ATPase subunit
MREQQKMPLIELSEISKLYGFGDATTLALDEINLSVERGEFIAIMGHSGSGKSTLLNIIGLLDRPTNGTFLLDNKNVGKLSVNRCARARRDHVGFIFQTFNLLPNMTVIENVALPLAYKNVSLSKRLKRASVALAKVNLSDKEYYFPHQLSGGQAQRVAIARALVTNPSIVIADEPTGNLDSVNSRRVMDLLSELHQAGNTILMVTHNPELTAFASRVIYMRDGTISTDEMSTIGIIPKSAQKLLQTVAWMPKNKKPKMIIKKSKLPKKIKVTR